MKKNIKYSVVLPCYQEANNLSLLLPELNRVLDKTGERYEILVIDTKEPLDNTAEVSEQNSARYINRMPENYYGDAVRTGIEKARGEWIIFMDSDGSHPPEFLAKMLDNIQDNDLVIASRYMKGGSTENPPLLVFVSKLLNKVYTILLRLNCQDISNSFRVYRAEQLKTIKLQCNNFDVVEEVLYKLIKTFPGFKIKEIPFAFKKRLHGESKRSMIVFIYSYLRTLVKLLFTKV